MDPEVLKVITTGGTTGVVVITIGWFAVKALIKVFDRMIAAIDRVGAKVDEHTINEGVHVADLRLDVAEIRGALGLPSSTPRRPTPPVGTPLRRAKTEDPT